jgi:predicted nucleotidyltransferase
MKLNWYFDELKAAIEPDQKYKEQAQKADDPVREHLRTHISFADYHIYTFLYGSYVRNTAIGNIKDVDLVIICNYSNYSSPLILLNKLRDSLAILYGDANLADQRRSIRVDQPLPDTYNSKLTLDVIPAIYQSGSDGALWVPDREKREWTASNPREHMAHTTRLNAASHQGRFVPLAKMMKLWWKYQFEARRPWVESFKRKPKGFWVETMTGQFVNLSKDSYPELIVSVFENAFSNFKRFRIDGKIPNLEDPGLPGKSIKTSMTANEFSFFLDTLEESLTLAQEAANVTSESRAVELWQAIFGTPGEISNSLKGTGDSSSLLKPAAVLSGSELRFPDKPLEPKNPGGFG